MKFVHQSNI